jgi:Domain of unknown function (DUF6048)
VLLKTSSCIFSFFLLFASSVYAQVQTKKDTLREPVKLTAIRVGIDVVQPIKTFAIKDFSGWEISADAELNHYYPIIEIGQWSRDVSLSNGQYTNNGNYWRMGVDINLLKKDPVKNMFFFGIRYGRSRYDEQLKYVITTDEFGSVTNAIKNTNLTSGWLELATGMRVKIAGGFWMGYTGRLKFAPGLHEEKQLQSYDIPGYGLTFKQPWWGFNYYVMWKFATKN